MAPSLAEMGVGTSTKAEREPSPSALWMGGGDLPGAASSPLPTWTLLSWTTCPLVRQSSTWNAAKSSAGVAVCPSPWSGKRTVAAGLPWTWWHVVARAEGISKGTVQLSWVRSVLQVSATRCGLGDRQS